MWEMTLGDDTGKYGKQIYSIWTVPKVLLQLKVEVMRWFHMPDLPDLILRPLHAIYVMQDVSMR